MLCLLRSMERKHTLIDPVGILINFLSMVSSCTKQMELNYY